MKNNVRYLFFCFCLLVPLWVSAENMVDPTKPPDSQAVVKTTTSSQPLSLTAIFIYPSYRMAIINGQTLRIGDHINEYTITAINPFTVELMRSENSKEVLSLTLTVKQLRPS